MYTFDTDEGTVEYTEPERSEEMVEMTEEMKLQENSDKLGEEINDIDTQQQGKPKSIFDTMKEKYEDYKDEKRRERVEKARMKSEYDRQLKEIKKKQALADYQAKLREKMRMSSMPATERRAIKKQQIDERITRLGNNLGVNSLPNFGDKARELAGVGNSGMSMKGNQFKMNSGGGSSDIFSKDKLRSMIGSGGSSKPYNVGSGSIPGKSKLMSYTGGGPNYGNKVRVLTKGSKMTAKIDKGFSKTRISELTGGGFSGNALKSELKGTPKGFTAKQLFGSGERDNKLKKVIGMNDRDKKLRKMLGR